MDNNQLKDTYNKIAENWHKDHQSDNWWQAGTDQFVSLLKPGALVLDVGCAGGTKSRYLIKKGMKVLGVDFSENLIDIAKKEVPAGEFRVLDIHHLDQLDQTFAGIFMQAVLLHIPKKEIEDILRQAVQKLSDNGYLYVAVKEKISGGVDEEVKVEDDYGDKYERFFSYFTFDEFKRYFDAVGLDIVYKDVLPPSRTARKSNWMQLIGKKR